MAKNRSYLFILLFVAAHFFHHLLTSIIAPLLPMIRDDFSLTYTQAGLVPSAFTLVYGLAQLPSGWVADKVGSRYLLFIGVSGVAVAGMLVGLSWSFPVLLAALALMGIAGGGYHPSAAPLVSQAVEPSKRGKALGMHLVGGSGSHFVSPLAAVFIAGFIGWQGAFLAISIPVFIFGFVLFILLRIRQIGVSGVGRKQNKEETAEPSQYRPLVEIVVFLIITSFINAVNGAIIAFIPLYGVDGIGVSRQASAIFLSVYFAAGMLGAPVIGGLADRLNLRKLFFILSLAAGPMIMLMGVSGSWILLIGIMMVLGMLMFARMVVSETFFVTFVPLKIKSTILGIYYFGGMEGSGILAPILGKSIDTWGFSLSFIGIGIMVLIISVGLFSYLGISLKKIPGEKAG